MEHHSDPADSDTTPVPVLYSNEWWPEEHQALQRDTEMLEALYGEPETTAQPPQLPLHSNGGSEQPDYGYGWPESYPEVLEVRSDSSLRSFNAEPQAVVPASDPSPEQFNDNLLDPALRDLDSPLDQQPLDGDIQALAASQPTPPGPGAVPSGSYQQMKQDAHAPTPAHMIRAASHLVDIFRSHDVPIAFYGSCAMTLRYPERREANAIELLVLKTLEEIEELLKTDDSIHIAPYHVRSMGSRGSKTYQMEVIVFIPNPKTGASEFVKATISACCEDPRPSRSAHLPLCLPFRPDGTTMISHQDFPSPGVSVIVTGFQLMSTLLRYRNSSDNSSDDFSMEALECITDILLILEKEDDLASHLAGARSYFPFFDAALNYWRDDFVRHERNDAKASQRPKSDIVATIRRLDHALFGESTFTLEVLAEIEKAELAKREALEANKETPKAKRQRRKAEVPQPPRTATPPAKTSGPERPRKRQRKANGSPTTQTALGSLPQPPQPATMTMGGSGAPQYPPPPPPPQYPPPPQSSFAPYSFAPRYTFAPQYNFAPHNPSLPPLQQYPSMPQQYSSAPQHMSAPQYQWAYSSQAPYPGFQ
ncbi:Uu.00g115360.m01.CDS01 [Anthostomella pinea]|uniref:Uu.00g115360.m01.CDS01 n=1 Tax=Anthostomella pinea TaxID=933095 RepID=A0AAI8YGV7_9PEZI|nr:Uu.00g115360.m01.CDS01 [Anthostomella pinea]